MPTSQAFFKEILLCSVAEVSVPGHTRFDFHSVSRSLYDSSRFGQMDPRRPISVDPLVRSSFAAISTKVKPALLKVLEIEQSVSSYDLLGEFGVNSCVEIAHIFDLVKLEEDNSPGFLLVNGLSNFIFSRTAQGVPVLINLVHTDVDWYMSYHLITGDYVCLEGRRIVYC